MSRRLDELLAEAQRRHHQRPGWPTSERLGRILRHLGRTEEAHQHLADAARAFERMPPHAYQDVGLALGDLWYLAGEPERSAANLRAFRARDEQRRAAGLAGEQDVPARIMAEFMLGDLAAVRRLGHEAGQKTCLPWAWSLVQVAEAVAAADRGRLEHEVDWWRRLVAREGIDTSGVHPSAADLLELVEARSLPVAPPDPRASEPARAPSPVAVDLAPSGRVVGWSHRGTLLVRDGELVEEVTVQGRTSRGRCASGRGWDPEAPAVACGSGLVVSGDGSAWREWASPSPAIGLLPGRQGLLCRDDARAAVLGPDGGLRWERAASRAAAAADGSVALVGNDGSLQVVDVEGRLQRRWEDDNRPLDQVAWLADGTVAAAVDAAQTVLVLDLRAGAVVAEWTEHDDGPVYALAACGRRVASTASSAEVVVWDLDTSRPVPLAPPSLPVDRIAFDPTGTYLCGTADDPAQVVVWDLGRTEPVLHVPGGRAAGWHPHASILAVATSGSLTLHRFG